MITHKKDTLQPLGRNVFITLPTSLPSIVIFYANLCINPHVVCSLCVKMCNPWKLRGTLTVSQSLPSMFR